MKTEKIYQSKRVIDERLGEIMIYPSMPEKIKVEFWQEADLFTGHADYRIIAGSPERALELYHNVALPEIERKERLYLAAGKFDRQNN